MILTDPTGIEGHWRLADDAAPGIGTVFTLRDGKVFSDGAEVAHYSIHGAALTFRTVRHGVEGETWEVAYAFDLPGPLADPASPGLFATEILRPNYLPGYMETIHAVGFGEDDLFSETCIFVRVD